MATAPSQEVTQLLRSWNEGDRAALEKLIPLVYSELHRLAKCYMRGEREGHLLQTTALINEAFIRLIEWKGVSWQNRAHFYGVSAGLMRRVLVDIARAQHRAKRGGSLSWVTLNEGAIPGGPARDVVAVDDALKSLEAFDPRKGRIVELRFFGGLSTEETAELFGVSTRTVEREWSLAQAWLLRELKHGQDKRQGAGQGKPQAEGQARHKTGKTPATCHDA